MIDMDRIAWHRWIGSACTDQAWDRGSCVLIVADGRNKITRHPTEDGRNNITRNPTEKPRLLVNYLQ